LRRLYGRRDPPASGSGCHAARIAQRLPLPDDATAGAALLNLAIRSALATQIVPADDLL
jgi:hypothetical protein